MTRLCLVLLAAIAPQDALIGDWKPADREVVVHIGKAGARYEGTTSADGGEVTILKGLTWDDASKVWRGEVWAPKRKAFYPAVIRLEAPDTFVLKAGTGLLSQEVTWHRR
jgi:uncharacterized protein (DUF2147 family)